MTRPRIRTIKPEAWADEKIGRLSRDARLLWVGLITMADDEGRFRALPSAILGHCFPYDHDAPRRLEGWLRELTNELLIVVYEIGGVRYGWFPKWENHQKINRKNTSLLPEPSVNGHGFVTEGSVNGH